jgi:D-lactate dehydrogenase
MADKQKVLLYSRRADEGAVLDRFSKELNVDVTVHTENPSLETAHFAKGFSAISIISTPVSGPLVRAFHELGVRFISTRSIGYDHIDLAVARELGIRISNVSYAPDTVANYTVMLMLMVTRKVKNISRLQDAQDFSLLGNVQGRVLRNLTVGIVGTGRIGARVIENLSGFGCPILAHDKYPNDAVRSRATYVGLDELFAKSDLISFHMPAADDNFHMVNAESMKRMKDGVFIINTARGPIIDTPAFLDAIESGKIGGAGLDVAEDEGGLYFNNLVGRPLKSRWTALLRSYPNVIVMPHTAFYTDQVTSDMAENSLRGCIAFLTGEKNPWEIPL